MSEDLFKEDTFTKYAPTLIFLSAIITCITGFVLRDMLIILSGYVLFMVSVWCMHFADKAEKSRQKILAMIRKEYKESKQKI